MSKPLLIFVYGTLKRGFCRNHYLNNFTCLGEFNTKPVYLLFDCGTYPGMIHDSKNGRPIVGEVYKVDEACLKTLDEVEGVHLGLYIQSVAEMDHDFEVPVITYLYHQSTLGMPDCGNSWTKKTEEGDL